MKIVEITENKKEYLDLLLLADEQEDMIDRYLDHGTMYKTIQHSRVTFYEKIEAVIVPRNILIAKPIPIPL